MHLMLNSVVGFTRLSKQRCVSDPLCRPALNCCSLLNCFISDPKSAANKPTRAQYLDPVQIFILGEKFHPYSRMTTIVKIFNSIKLALTPVAVDQWMHKMMQRQCMMHHPPLLAHHLFQQCILTSILIRVAVQFMDISIPWSVFHQGRRQYLLQYRTQIQSIPCVC